MVPTTVFNGNREAAEREKILSVQVAELRQQGKNLAIGAILFSEDQGSVLYTRLKKEAAERVGIEYRITTFSLRDDVATISAQIQTWNTDPTLTGIIIQKPWRHTWLQVTDGTLSPEAGKQAFQAWWHSLVNQLVASKDVDGLHPSNLATIKAGTWQTQGRVLPATCQAVLEIMAEAYALPSADALAQLSDQKIGIIGVSDLLGYPLQAVLEQTGLNSQLLTRTVVTERLAQPTQLHEFDVIVSATGQANWLEASWLKPGSVLIDVGEPRPDLNLQTLPENYFRFLSPVPGGVGPMTVACLLANCVQLARS